MKKKDKRDMAKVKKKFDLKKRKVSNQKIKAYYAEKDRQADLAKFYRNNF